MFERLDIIEFVTGSLSSPKCLNSPLFETFQANHVQVRPKAVQFSFWRTLTTFKISSRGGQYVR